MVKDNILLKAIVFFALFVVAFKTLSFETNVDSQVVGADLTITKVNNDGGDLTIGGALTVNGVQNASVPAGVIVMWSGATNAIPSGWAICNGANGTPDLQGRFVVGYSASNGDYDVGDTGGSDQQTLTTSHLPTHNHTIRGTDTNDNVSGGWVAADANGSYLSPGNNFTYNQPRPKVDLTQNGNSRNTDTPNRDIYITESSGSGSGFDNRPAYYALAYIMKL